MNRVFKNAGLVVVTVWPEGLVRMERTWLINLTFKYFELELFLGHSGRNVQKKSDHRSMRLKRKVQYTMSCCIGYRDGADFSTLVIAE